MKLRNLAWLAFAAATALSISHLEAQQTPVRHRHQAYTVVDLGTFGGPNAHIFSGPPSYDQLNSRGVALGQAGTTIPDPYPVCWDVDCVVHHAFSYVNGVLYDLGALPGTNSSVSAGITNNGAIVGVSENGSLDPLTGYPETRAVSFTRQGVVDLGTFGGNVSAANGLNSRGQIVGTAANAISDDYSSSLGPCATAQCWPVATQLRAYLWWNGLMQDLGTLGGNDASAFAINDRGQVTGVSYTNDLPNGTTGVPTQDPFFWENGRMVDVGTLGGTFGYPWRMNSRGQVVGQSNLAGDQAFHAFLWDRGRLTDLGTLGGSLSLAFWINDAGAATGAATTPGDQGAHGVLWKNGQTIDLGSLPGFPRSTGISINSSEQIAGNVFTDDFSVFHAMVWQDGEIIDLNAFVPPGSGITLSQANVINDRGEIYAQGSLANGDSHLFLLYPAGNCDAACEQRIREGQNGSLPRQSNNVSPTVKLVGRTK